MAFLPCSQECTPLLEMALQWGKMETHCLIPNLPNKLTPPETYNAQHKDEQSVPVRARCVWSKFKLARQEIAQHELHVLRCHSTLATLLVHLLSGKHILKGA